MDTFSFKEGEGTTDCYHRAETNMQGRSLIATSVPSWLVNTEPIEEELKFLRRRRVHEGWIIRTIHGSCRDCFQFLRLAVVAASTIHKPDAETRPDGSRACFIMKKLISRTVPLW